MALQHMQSMPEDTEVVERTAGDFPRIKVEGGGVSEVTLNEGGRSRTRRRDRRKSGPLAWLGIVQGVGSNTG